MGKLRQANFTLDTLISKLQIRYPHCQDQNRALLIEYSFQHIFFVFLTIYSQEIYA